MKYLLTDSGERTLRTFGAKKTLFAFDFDGTLCPIVDSPREARVPLETQALLRWLTPLSPVAVISGRAVDDLRPRLDCPEVHFVGNHGAEGVFPIDDAQAVARTCEAWQAHLEDALPPGALAAGGIMIENKRYSLSIHYRKSTHRPEALAAIQRAVKNLSPVPRAVAGHFVLNLVPATSRHKGDAVLGLMDALGCENALYVGDDVTDEDVFRLEERRLLSVRIEPDGASGAKYFLYRQPEINRLLELILSIRRGLPRT